MAQIAAERLGVDLDNVEVLHGDTSVVPLGMDTYGSRSLAVGGVALHKPPARCSTRCASSPPISSRWRRTTSSSKRLSVKGSPDRGMTVPEAALQAWTAHNLPDGWSRAWRRRTSSTPRTSPGRRGRTSRWSSWIHGDGAVDLIRYMPWTTSASSSTPRSWTARCTEVVQGVAQALWEEATYDEDGTSRARCSTTSSRAPPSCRRSSSTGRRRTVRPTRSVSRAWGRRARSPRRLR